MMNTKMLCGLCKQTMDDDRMVLSTCGHACCTHCAQQQCATRLALRMAKRGVLAQLDPAAIPATCTVCGMKSPLVTDTDNDIDIGIGTATNEDGVRPDDEQQARLEQLKAAVAERVAEAMDAQAAHDLRTEHDDYYAAEEARVRGVFREVRAWVDEKEAAAVKAIGAARDRDIEATQKIKDCLQVVREEGERLAMAVQSSALSRL